MRPNTNLINLHTKIDTWKIEKYENVELDHVSPCPQHQCWKMSHFFNKKEKNHPIVNIV